MLLQLSHRSEKYYCLSVLKMKKNYSKMNSDLRWLEIEIIGNLISLTVSVPVIPDV